MSEEQFIQGAIEHPGSLKKWAAMNGFQNEDGTIDLRTARSYAQEHGLKHRLRQINLAMTLKKLRR